MISIMLTPCVHLTFLTAYAPRGRVQLVRLTFDFEVWHSRSGNPCPLCYSTDEVEPQTEGRHL